MRDDEALGRLRDFLRWLIPVVYGFAIVETVAFALSRDARIGLTAVIAFGYGILVTWAWRAAGRGAVRPAVVAVWLGLMVAGVASAVIQPILHAGLLLVPIVAVMVALPYERGSRLVRLLLVAWIAAGTIGALGVVLPTEQGLPAWFLATYRLATIVGGTGILLLLLGQYNDRLTGALARSEAANVALREARGRLEEEWEQLETILRSIHDGVVATDAAGTVVFLNPVAEELTGWRANEAIGRDVGEVVAVTASADAPRDTADAIGRTLSGEGETDTAPGARLVDRDGGERRIAGHAAPLHGTDGRTIGAVLVLRDVTREIEADEERRRIEHRISEADKVESLARLAGGVAHDFNNLLATILGNAALALADLPPDAPARASIEEIEGAGRRAAELARQMLAYSGRGRLDVGPVDLNGLVAEAEPLLRATLPPDVDVRLELAPDLPEVDGDAVQLRQVLLNLGTNAGEAIHERQGDGGVVTIATRLVEAGDPLLASAEGPLEPGRYAALAVADTGIGMTPETAARVFDPFFSTKFTGRGLGLAAVLGIVRGHGGAVRLESEHGTGSRFTVLLPASAARGRDPTPPPATAGGSREAVRVLVVDDDPGVRAVAGAMLGRLGHPVIEASDGAAAVAAFEDATGTIGAVLLDLTMPGLDGADALARLRAIDPAVPVVVMSGWSADEAASRLQGGRPAGFLRKPFTLAELEAALGTAGAPGR